MSDVDSILRESIRQTCGPGGVHKFSAFYAGSFEKEDGRPDMEGIRKAVDSTFTSLESIAIMASVMKRLRKAGEPVPQHTETVPVAETQTKSGNQDAAMVRYFQADPNNVRDIVFEARRMRMSMGKPITAQISWMEANTDAVASTENAREIKASKTTIDRAPTQEPVKKRSEVIAAPVSEIDREIEQFAYSQTAFSSIDIIDFIRYLKDKGYSFQEYIVLEKIYVKIEERKKETRYALEKEVEGLFNGAQAPMEPDISRLIGRLRDAGLVFEEEEVRRMVRVATLRKT